MGEAAYNPLPKGKRGFLLAYASDTGGTAGVAEALHKQAISKRFAPNLFNLVQFRPGEVCVSSTPNNHAGHHIRGCSGTITAPSTPLQVLVMGTTRGGEAPADAARYVTWLEQEERIIREAASRGSPRPLPLEGVFFTLLGARPPIASTPHPVLKDSNALNAGALGPHFRKLLLGLGAQEFYSYAEADDMVGYDETIEPWAAGLWQPLGKAIARSAVGRF